VKAIRELLEFIAEQAVAADLGRRLLQDAVTAREAQIRRAIKAEKEVDRLTHELEKALAIRPSIQQEVTK
jgi:hypothetical protein